MRRSSVSPETTVQWTNLGERDTRGTVSGVGESNERSGARREQRNRPLKNKSTVAQLTGRGDEV